MLMRHYEITLIVHPDQSSQVTTMIEKYKELITSGGGIVHRQEDWGRKHLAYPINKIYKAHYLLMNIECDQDTLDKLNYNFRFNDAVIRNLIISKSKAITEPSIMLTKTEKDKVEDKAKFKAKDTAKFKAKDKVEVKAKDKVEVKVKDKVEEKIEAKVEDTE
jgi:small subunit ribosomal protein S6